MKIGWIGLGRIGLPMALALLKSGNHVVAHSRRPHEHAILVERGGTLVNAAKHVLDGVAALGINVFSEEQLDDVLNGSGGMISDIPGGTIVFIHSTVSPGFMRRLADRRRDVHWLDCAFSGTAADVDNANLTLMVGGNAEILQRLTPVLLAYCRHIHHVGDTGAGLTLKLINNSLFAANVQLSLDALNAAQDSGIDVNLAGRVLSQSSGGSYALNVLASGGDPFRRAVEMNRYLDKDVRVARDAAIASNVDLKRIAQVTGNYGN